MRLKLLIALALLVAVAVTGCGGAEADSAAGGDARPLSLEAAIADGHVHSLRVDPTAPERLLLGVHGGLYRSGDGGESWQAAGLAGDDAMNVVGAPGGGTLLVAGHNVLQRSEDGGASWAPVDPVGLPNLDLHGFAVRPGHPREVVAAAAGEGLYGSNDGGQTFQTLSRQVGASVFGMSLRADGTLFAADPQAGLLASRDGGRSFVSAIEGPGFVSVAASPEGPGLVIAGGDPGIVVSDDAGRTWSTAFTEAGVGAVALAPSDPRRAYAVGADAVMYVSRDAGRSWTPAAGGPEA